MCQLVQRRPSPASPRGGGPSPASAGGWLFNALIKERVRFRLPGPFLIFDNFQHNWRPLSSRVVVYGVRAPLCSEKGASASSPTCQRARGTNVGKNQGFPGPQPDVLCVLERSTAVFMTTSRRYQVLSPCQRHSDFLSRSRAAVKIPRSQGTGR